MCGGPRLQFGHAGSFENQGPTIRVRKTMRGAQNILKLPLGFFAVSALRKPDSLTAGY
jgi:hypothetical protein